MDTWPEEEAGLEAAHINDLIWEASVYCEDYIQWKLDQNHNLELVSK